MRFFYVAFLIFLTPLIQYTLIPFLTFRHFTPDLFLIMTVYFSLSPSLRGQGYIFGLGLGLIQDLLGGGILGVNISAKGFLGLAVEFITDRFLSINLLTHFLLFFLATFIDAAITIVVIGNYLQELPLFQVFMRSVLFRYLLNLTWGIPLIMSLFHLESRFRMGKVRSPQIRT